MLCKNDQSSLLWLQHTNDWHMAADEETSAAHYLDVSETPAVQFTLSAVH